MRSKFFVLSLILAMSLAVPAGSEIFLDSYIGPAFTSNGKFNNGPAASATTKFDTVGLENRSNLMVTLPVGCNAHRNESKLKISARIDRSLLASRFLAMAALV
jgi:hypothetical protein